jgi:hypothetical protein
MGWIIKAYDIESVHIWRNSWQYELKVGSGHVYKLSKHNMYEVLISG